MEKQQMITRHKLAGRLCHWFIVATGLFTFLTGFSFLYQSFQWLGFISGTPQLARVLHPFVGLAMCVALMLMLSRYYGHNKWIKGDFKWLLSVKEVLLQNEDKIPPAGHYNAGQKMLFRMFVVCGLGLIISGFIMWQPYFAPHFSAATVQWAVMCHAVFALIMALGLIVHVWMAAWIEGSITGMLYGKVSRAWLHKHHPLALKEIDENSQETH
ncbi:formate dehydrogenase subunit gamma [Shewanella sp. NFH-SH190041]|uniref:formate dehydrogenase subunit gamma n=1 Tax=Shewanella sp. NFH-SH190041 TaxID=2950245 RepID=UPI0021C3B530|nr:formate dehydrogenase subunit gamma [Shewanella sp. NFH-SH190041]BDM63205.1 formate dehydrogenase subunit gamma [Shewanella sp. NFH-SH190041]